MAEVLIGAPALQSTRGSRLIPPSRHRSHTGIDTKGSQIRGSSLLGAAASRSYLSFAKIPFSYPAREPEEIFLCSALN